jgi:hypothetical protein
MTGALRTFRLRPRPALEVSRTAHTFPRALCRRLRHVVNRLFALIGVGVGIGIGVDPTSIAMPTRSATGGLRRRYRSRSDRTTWAAGEACRRAFLNRLHVPVGVFARSAECRVRHCGGRPPACPGEPHDHGYVGVRPRSSSLPCGGLAAAGERRRQPIAAAGL